ncbi:MAG: DUF4347 domain-containing protein, partial [Cyanobacteria bacterium J06639_1]
MAFDSASSAALPGAGEFSFETSLVSELPPQREVVFIDDSVDNYQDLLDRVSTQADVVILDRSQDGIAQIGQVLSQYENLDAVHVVSHGDAGSLQLGSTTLDSSNLSHYTDELQQWSNAFSEDADLLFYGCHVGGSPDGLLFVDRLADLTGADVAASDNLTGSADAGGDWDFEVVTGAIETDLAFGAVESLSGVALATALSGTLSGTNEFSDDVTISSAIALDGDVQLDVFGDVTIDLDGTIAGNNAGDRDNLTIVATGKVTIGGDIKGGGLQNISITAGAIEVQDDVLISSRTIDEAGTTPNFETAASVGDSGSISLIASGEVGGETEFSDETTALDIGEGAQILAHAIGSGNAGNVELKAEDTSVRLGLTPFGFSNKTVRIDVDNATIKGNDITIQADAIDNNPLGEAPSYLQKAVIRPFVNGTAATVFGALSNSFGLPAASVQVRGSETKVRLDGGSIDASGAVNIASNSAVDSSLEAISVVSRGLSRMAVAFGFATGKANTTIAGGTTINAGSNVEVLSDVKTTNVARSKVLGNILSPLGIPANAQESGLSFSF